jgi:hypothetical protein
MSRVMAGAALMLALTIAAGDAEARQAAKKKDWPQAMSTAPLQ